MYKNNAQAISKATEKMKNNELTVEDVLDEEDLVNDLKSPSFSQLISFLTVEKMQKMLDYILIEPPTDSNQKIGHKFPYYACEVLCSENVFLLEKYFEDINKTEEKDEEKEDGPTSNRSGEHHDHNQENNTETSHKVNLKEKYFDDNHEEKTEEKPEEKVEEKVEEKSESTVVEKSEETTVNQVEEKHEEVTKENNTEEATKKSINAEDTQKEEDKTNDIFEVLDNTNEKERTHSINIEVITFYI